MKISMYERVTGWLICSLICVGWYKVFEHSIVGIVPTFITGACFSFSILLLMGSMTCNGRRAYSDNRVAKATLIVTFSWILGGIAFLVSSRYGIALF
jgi:hypothetical protein